MKRASFADIVVAFSDFLTCMENAADEATFRHAKKFCTDVLRSASFVFAGYFDGGNEE